VGDQPRRWRVANAFPRWRVGTREILVVIVEKSEKYLFGLEYVKLNAQLFDIQNKERAYSRNVGWASLFVACPFDKTFTRRWARKRLCPPYRKIK